MNSSSTIFIALVIGIGIFLGFAAGTLTTPDFEVATADLSASEIRELHPEWSLEDCELVADQVVIPGMTEEMVVCSWGLPTRTWKADKSDNHGTFWFYGDSRYPDPVTLLFRGGTLIQYHSRG